MFELFESAENSRQDIAICKSAATFKLQPQSWGDCPIELPLAMT
jgi:hypothetical protein